MIKFLAEQSKDLNHQCTSDPKFPGYAALHFACAEHNPAAAAILVKLGANPNIENVDELLPIWYADEMTKLALISALHAREAGI